MPPVPTVNLPKFSEAVEVCVSTIGATMVADAEPDAVEVLPEAAWAAETLPSAAIVAANPKSALVLIMVSPVVVARPHAAWCLPDTHAVRCGGGPDRLVAIGRSRLLQDGV